MCPHVDWRGSDDCEGWEMGMGLEAAEILSVYAVFVAIPLASDRKGRQVGATTPVPCRNGS